MTDIFVLQVFDLIGKILLLQIALHVISLLGRWPDGVRLRGDEENGPVDFFYRDDRFWCDLLIRIVIKYVEFMMRKELPDYVEFPDFVRNERKLLTLVRPAGRF